MKIPKRIQVGGQVLNVEYAPNLDGSLGKCCVAGGWIKIADTFDGIQQSPSSKENTFLHEVTHAILETMGRTDLNKDEVFVCGFASFLSEIVRFVECDSDTQETTTSDNTAHELS